jgi:DNA-directed RNA polymerase specialized sigma24 family protein
VRQSHVARQSGRKYRDATDAAVIEAMRRDDRWAWAEYFARFYPPLEEYARRARIPRAEWNSCIMDVLDDAALKFTSADIQLPRSLTHYLIVSVRHRYLNLLREEKSRLATYQEASHAGEAREESLVDSACSEDWLRAGRSPDEEPDPLGRALCRLALVIAGGLIDSEWELVTCLGERIPIAQIAIWLGLSYEATRKRCARLRKRLQTTAQEHIPGFPPAEQEELRRFFARVRRRKAALPRGASGADTGGDAA